MQITSWTSIVQSGQVRRQTSEAFLYDNLEPINPKPEKIHRIFSRTGQFNQKCANFVEEVRHRQLPVEHDIFNLTSLQTTN